MSVTAPPEGTKLVPHGKGFALPIDASLLRELGIDETTPITVTVEGGRLMIAKAAAHATKEQVTAALENVNREWGGVLKKLAE
jgi:antitoxin component of MazEF toxin-antitoxin module